MLFYHFINIVLDQGSRSDLRAKKERQCTATVLASDNFYSGQQHVPPSWVHVFYSSNTPKPSPSSQRTQAAAIAFLFSPKNVNNISSQLRSQILSVRDRKLLKRFVFITIPPLFHSIAKEHSKSWTKSEVIVCDGGIDHIIPSSPPKKVSLFHNL